MLEESVTCFPIMQSHSIQNGSRTVLEECECLDVVEEKELCGQRHLQSNLACIFYNLCDTDLVT